MLCVKNIRLDYGQLKGQGRYRITARENPVISWAAEADGKNVRQAAYRLRVWCGPGTLWDTGWVESEEQEAVYGGAVLPKERRISLGIALRDHRGEVSREREEFFFRSGLQRYETTWIAASEDQGERAVYFKKDFVLEKRVAHAVCYACGLGFHELYLNGRKLDQAVLDPAISDYTRHCYFAYLPETEGLLEKENCISAILGQGWRRNGDCSSRGWDSVRFFGIPQLALVLSLTYEDGTEEVIRTDGSWLWGTGPVVYSNLFHGETFDARRQEENWNCFGGKVSGFSRVKPVQPPGGENLPMVLEPVIAGEQYKAALLYSPGSGMWLADFGQNIAGVCALRIPKGLEQGQRITLKFSERLDQDGTVYMDTLRTARSTDTYIAAGDGRDLEEWRPKFTYHGFRYVQIEGLEELRPEDITAVSWYTDAVLDSFFHCGSALVNKIWKNMVQTEKANIHSILTDCPQRDERLGWLNDATVRFEAVPYQFDIGRLFPKVVEDILDTQSADGAITCTAPYVLGHRPADPVCSSFLIAARQAMLHTGNTDVIRRAYDGFVRWERRLGEMAQGHILSYSHYGDWAGPVYACEGGEADIDATRSGCTPGSFMSTGYYYYNAVLLQEFSRILGKKEEADFYRKLAREIRQAMLDQWWDEERAVMATGSQGCQSFALWLGIIPENRRREAAQRIHEDLVKRGGKITTGNLCTRYLLEALTQQGYVDDAWAFLTREEYPSFGYMIQNEATTVWERFELKKSPNMNSHNHPMYGAAAYWFYAYLAGIKPTGKGFARMRIQPFFPKKLLSVNAKVETVRGAVAVRWVKSYGKCRLYVTVPFSTEAEVVFAGKRSVVGSGFHVFEADEVCNELLSGQEGA